MSAYMVFVQGKDAPKAIHANLARAMTEAIRLSTIEPDCEVMILKVMTQINGKRIQKVLSATPATINSPKEEQAA